MRTGLAVALLVLAGCGAPAGELDAAVDAGGAIDAQPTGACETAVDCDDGVYCNGHETCVANLCVAGTIVCDDGIACTIDRCDESLRTCTFRAPDADDDGARDAHCTDTLGLPLGTDCADGDPETFPGNTEDCDDHDEDCDPETVGGEDTDHDGYTPWDCCNPVEGAEPHCGLDCDDTRADISRVATEVCDAIDNDCDESIDEHATDESWPDADHDGFGDEGAMPDFVCLVPSSRANVGGDCDDVDRRVHPFQTEECNGLDDDCDGTVDEGGDLACGGRAATTSVCVAGECRIIGCAPGHFDCNHDVTDGCEPLCTTSASCGTCGRACPPALHVCGGGFCPGINYTMGVAGVLTDLVTGEPIAGATITTIDTCTPVSTTTAADGSWSLEGFVGVTWVRLEAPGRPTHVLPMSGPLVMLPASLVDAWAADPDVARPRSDQRAILVVDVGPSEITRDRDLGLHNVATGSDLEPVGTIGRRHVFFDVVPGHARVGGTEIIGHCFTECGPERQLWLEPGAVTFVPDVACVVGCIG